MITNNYSVIGVMSGTSLDGVDLVYCKYILNDQWRFEIEHATTIPYNLHWYATLKDISTKSIDEIGAIDENYTSYLAGIINDFITKHKIVDIDFVSSHGHTTIHQPEKGITYQIGNRALISQLLSLPVVCDFRVEDVALGGQGAPLVPIGDRMLFREYDYCLNLGGFSNISFEESGERIAYDICPVNIVMNHYARKLGYEYDKNGALASNGVICNNLLERLNKLTYYGISWPKSLGIEWVITEVFPLIDSFKLSVEDVLRTFCEHIAIQIGNIFSTDDKVALITGGGVYNRFLMNRLNYFSRSIIEIPTDEIIEFKEALIFGFLGVLKMRGENNCLKSVTGASKDHCSGKIFYPKNSN